jgi:Flp pilus assembly protein TadG
MNCRCHRTAGNAALEFALVFLLLWLLLSGAFQVGYSIYIYDRLVTAAAGGARYAARVDFDSPAHSFIIAVQNMTAYGSPSGGTSPLAPGLNSSNIAVTWTTDTTGMPLTLTVSITGYSVDAVFQTIKWSGKPSVTVRFAGRYLS